MAPARGDEAIFFSGYLLTICLAIVIAAKDHILGEMLLLLLVETCVAIRTSPLRTCARCGAVQYRCAGGQRNPIRNRAEPDNFLTMARGPVAEIARAKSILGTVNPTRLDVRTGVKALEPANAAGG